MGKNTSHIKIAKKVCGRCCANNANIICEHRSLYQIYLLYIYQYWHWPLIKNHISYSMNTVTNFAHVMDNEHWAS